MMNTMTDPIFWGEVGLAMAARLALLAAVVWVARMAGARRTMTVATPAGRSAVRPPKVRLSRGAETAPVRFIDLRHNAPETGGVAANSDLRPADRVLSRRLTQYLQQKPNERNTA